MNTELRNTIVRITGQPGTLQALASIAPTAAQEPESPEATVQKTAIDHQVQESIHGFGSSDNHFTSRLPA